MFLPTTLEETRILGWDALDVILVTGDSYIDSPFMGVALIGKWLVHHGFRVGIIAQPDISSDEEILRLGEPRLYWGVTAGAVDSMVANYTALQKPRRSDDYTPGGKNTRRPDRATIVYSNLIRRASKRFHPGLPTKPIVLGGIEASLRRVAHYDYWSDSIRRSVLFDAKADYIIYGMAEIAVLELTKIMDAGKDPRDVRGICYISRKEPAGYLPLPSFDKVNADKQAFIKMFQDFYTNNDPISGKGLYQQHGDRFLIQNPPAQLPNQAELDAFYSLEFERVQHPYYESQGPVKALETVKFSICTHRGCYGECSFCAIAVHEGRTVTWRSSHSILAEARRISTHPDFKGYIPDVGGPTANMYGFECSRKLIQGACPEKSCLYPKVCPLLKINHHPLTNLLVGIRQIEGIKKAFVASGLRYDMILADTVNGIDFLKEIVAHHVSGQLKVAPEHTESHILSLMGKPDPGILLQFKSEFDRLNRVSGKKQFLTYYLIAGHPGCTNEDMQKLKYFSKEKLHTNPEQVQIFTPTPSTYGSLMYFTGFDPFTMQPVFVEKNLHRKKLQKDIVTRKPALEFS